MAKFTVTAFASPAARDAAIALLEADSAVYHRLYGGDRVEAGATGVGPTAQRWLQQNGPPGTTGYSNVSVDDATSEARLRLLGDLAGELATDEARAAGLQRLVPGERGAAAARLAAAVDRGPP